MKSAKTPTMEAQSHRRSQPVRQTRINPPRGSTNPVRAGRRDSLSGPIGDQPIDIFPAVTHFADTITALPKELVRHFTLLKEVDAKIFAPEEQLFKLVAVTRSLPFTESRANNDDVNSTAPGSAPMSIQGSSSGNPFSQRHQTATSTDESNNAVFDPSNLQRRQLFRQTAFKIQEMLVSLEEKNHVISTANEALQRQLARVEDVWPYLEGEFSDEAKWGSTTHWAYHENRHAKASATERSRRDGAAAISAAAQALVDQAAARSDARKQAVQAKKNQKNQSNDSDADEHDGRLKEATKKSQINKVRKPTETNNVGLGISTGTSTNGNPPSKRRKIEKDKDKDKEKGKEKEKEKEKEKDREKEKEKETDKDKDKDMEKEKEKAKDEEDEEGKEKEKDKERTKDKMINDGVPMERALSAVVGNSGSKTKPASPQESPAPEAPKKRKALPTSSGLAKKKNSLASAISHSATSSPVPSTLPEAKAPSRPSPAPGPAPSRPTSSRARQNSLQSNSDNTKAKPASSTAAKSNGNSASTPEMVQINNWSRPNVESKIVNETVTVVKTEPVQKELDQMDKPVAPITNLGLRDNKTDEIETKSEAVRPAQPTTVTVTTKSGRASKPSTPALPNFQEVARPRTTRNTDLTSNGKKSQPKKSSSVIQALATQLADEDGVSSMLGDEEEDEADIDADEPTYCYCNSVSYGEMVACDSDDCAREWFHLACVGLKVAPSSKTKWYCEDCKERLKTGGKKTNSR